MMLAATSFDCGINHPDSFWAEWKLNNVLEKDSSAGSSDLAAGTRPHNGGRRAEGRVSQP